MYGYFASHFFNDAMFQWTEKLASRIERETGLELYVPQRNDGINNKKDNDDTITAEAISKADTLELKRSNILIACLDGLTIDDGVSGEVMAHGIMAEFEQEHGIDFPRLQIGIITDMRMQGTGDNRLYRNQMIIGKIQEHGQVVIGYPMDEKYIEEVIALIKDFMAKHS